MSAWHNYSLLTYLLLVSSAACALDTTNDGVRKEGSPREVVRFAGVADSNTPGAERDCLEPTNGYLLCADPRAQEGADAPAAAQQPSNQEVEPDPHRGLYAIWARDSQIAGLDFLKGGQVVLQWKDLQTGPDQYDFARLDAALKEHGEADRPVTIQVNGNRKPEFLYAVVPCLAEKLSIQIGDAQGSLMYWHKAHVRAYLAFVEAYGKHVRESPYRDTVLGVRLNFNALGTEHMHVPPEFQDVSLWKCPVGVEPGPRWNREIMEDYRQQVVRCFERAFRPDIRVFVRNNVVRDEVTSRWLMEKFDAGQLALFHTSSEIEPRSQGTQQQYQAFLRWARPGHTVAYAESWADAWGRHGGIRDERWCSPCQWNYWRLLVDLHCGVSFIAVYGADLAASKQDPEFRSALQFAAKYAGYHASPSQSPGAWIALREGQFLAGDYTFLMQRLDDPTQPVRLAGPADQRYGAWARRMGPGGQMRLHIDRRFLEARSDTLLLLRVIYLDEGSGTCEVRTAGLRESVQLTDSGRWQTAQWRVSAAALAAAADTQITIRTGEEPITLHMVEVCLDP